jgi:hypothetical protein
MDTTWNDELGDWNDAPGWGATSIGELARRRRDEAEARARSKDRPDPVAALFASGSAARRAASLDHPSRSAA